MSDTRSLSARHDELVAEIARLADLPDITAVDDARLSTLTRELQITRAKLATVERAPGHDAPTFWRQTPSREVFESPGGFDGRSKTDLALRAVDVVSEQRRRIDGGEVRSEVRRHLEASPAFADYFRATADPDYLRAFTKLTALGDAGAAMLRMSDAEKQAMARVADAEVRAASLTDAAGGYAVPQLLDPSVIIHNAGVTNPIRQIARKVTGISDVWTGVNSAGVTASWDAEATEVSDDAPTLAAPTITAHKGAAFIPFSIELDMDWESLSAEAARMFADAKDRLEGAAFATGSGSGQPWGILTRLATNTATTVNITPTTDGAFGVEDLYKTMNNLPARYRPNSSWVMGITTLSRVRQFATANNYHAFATDLQGGYGFRILGRPAYESSDFPSTATLTTGSMNLLVLGDFDHYVVFDRLASMRVELVPHLFSTGNGRPTGQRGLYAYWRTGADVDVAVAGNVANVGFALLANA